MLTLNLENSVKWFYEAVIQSNLTAFWSPGAESFTETARGD